jgi:hypothetical protein
MAQDDMPPPNPERFGFFDGSGLPPRQDGGRVVDHITSVFV